jgi:hypothetical protein
MDGRARASAPRGSRHAVVTIAVAVVLAFILVVVPLPDAASQIPGGLAHACADCIQRSASDISSPLCRGMTCHKVRPALAAAGTNSWPAHQVDADLGVRLAEAETRYRNRLAREMHERGRRDAEAEHAEGWRRIAAPVADGRSFAEIEERRWGPGGREHLADPRRGDFPGRGAEPGQEAG